MSAPPGYDLDALIKWTARDEWRPYVSAVMTEHLDSAMQAFGLEFAEIGRALGGNWGNTLWGCAFEDFLTRRFGPDEQNPVESYLRRRGWKERVMARTYMTALQNSVMSLYELSDILPGQSLRARDLIRGGEPVFVTERSATQTLKSWDRLAARIVPLGGRWVLAGGLLAFTLEGSQQLFGQLREGIRQTPARPRGAKRPKGALEGWYGSDDDLRRAAPLFSNAWLFDVLPRALGTEVPSLLNSDGDEVVFHTVTFPLQPEVTTADIERRLNAVDQLRQETPSFWNWLGSQPPRPLRPKGKALLWNVTMDDGSLVLGNVALCGHRVALSVSSAARAERGGAVLADALVGMAGTPLTEIQTVAQLRAARPHPEEQPQKPIPAEIEAKLLRDTLDRQYRALLGEPIAMLGDISPRAAAKTARGRKRLAIWLKQLENHSQHLKDQSDPIATYDFTWLWRELNVEHLKN